MVKVREDYIADAGDENAIDACVTRTNCEHAGIIASGNGCHWAGNRQLGYCGGTGGRAFDVTK